MWLKNEAIAQIAFDCIQRGIALGHYELGAFVILANHVHLLILPRIEPSRLLRGLKGCSAREANKILHRTGEPFWQAESYDHWVRGPQEWQRIAHYIHQNPVKAGIVAAPGDYRWSSAGAGMSPGAAGTSACATI